MKEVWKDIKGYEKTYLISSYGRVKSLDRYIIDKNGVAILKRGKVLSQWVANKDYSRVLLSLEGKQKLYRVHRLVAQAFIPNPDNLPCVNHKDEVKSNNHVDNLEWCTHAYNALYGTTQARRKLKLYKPVLQIDKVTGKVIKEWSSAKEAGDFIGDPSCITKCCKKKPKYKTHKGFVWRYKWVKKMLYLL